jgi:uncharacterized protein YhaN
LANALSDNGVSPITGSDIAPLISQAKQVLDNLLKSEQERNNHKKELISLKQKYDKLEDALTKTSKTKDLAKEEFNTLLAGLGFQVNSPNESKNLLSQIDQIDSLVQSINALTDRIAGIDHRSDIFEQQLRSAANGFLNLSETTHIDAARTLGKLLKEERATYDKYLSICESLTTERDGMESLTSQLVGCEAELKELLKENGIEYSDAISSLVTNSLTYYSLEQEINRIENELIDQTGGRSLSEAFQNISDTEIEKIDTELKQIDTESKELEKDLAIVQEDKIAIQLKIDEMDGSEAAAGKAALAENCLAEIIENGEQYARLILANYIAEEAISRYGAKHQNPLLQKASGYFKEITDGRYQ